MSWQLLIIGTSPLNNVNNVTEDYRGTSRDQQQWCSGVVGTGSNVETVRESVEVDEHSPLRFLYSGVRVTQSTEVRAPSRGRDGSLRSSKSDFFEVTGRHPFALACEITSARQVWCQRLYWGVDD